MCYLQHPGTTRVCENIGSHLLHYGRRIPLEEWDARISVGIYLFAGIPEHGWCQHCLPLVCWSNTLFTYPFIRLPGVQVDILLALMELSESLAQTQCILCPCDWSQSIPERGHAVVLLHGTT